MTMEARLKNYYFLLLKQIYTDLYWFLTGLRMQSFLEPVILERNQSKYLQT